MDGKCVVSRIGPHCWTGLGMVTGLRSGLLSIIHVLMLMLMLGLYRGEAHVPEHKLLLVLMASCCYVFGNARV